MRTESLLVSSPQKSGRHDVTLNSASHSVVRIPPRHSGPAYDVVAILDPATRAAQKYTPVIMVSVRIFLSFARLQPFSLVMLRVELNPDRTNGELHRRSNVDVVSDRG